MSTRTGQHNELHCALETRYNRYIVDTQQLNPLQISNRPVTPVTSLSINNLIRNKPVTFPPFYPHPSFLQRRACLECVLPKTRTAVVPGCSKVNNPNYLRIHEPRSPNRDHFPLLLDLGNTPLTRVLQPSAKNTLHNRHSRLELDDFSWQSPPE